MKNSPQHLREIGAEGECCHTPFLGDVLDRAGFRFNTLTQREVPGVCLFSSLDYNIPFRFVECLNKYSLYVTHFLAIPQSGELHFLFSWFWQWGCCFQQGNDSLQ